MQEYAEANPGKNLAASAAGMLTGGLAGRPSAAIGLGGATKEGAKVAGTQGAIQGAAEGEGLEGRAIGAVTGGAIGTVIGIAAPLIGAGARAVGAPVVNTFRSAINPEREAARRVAEAARRDAAGTGMSPVDVYRAKKDGAPVANMDRGENSRALAQAAANQSPDARQAIDDVVAPRFQTQARRMNEKLAEESKLGGNPEKFMEMAEQAATKANRKLYNEAYRKGSGGIWDDTLEQMVNSPTVQRALKAAITKADDRNVLEGFGAFRPKVKLDEAGNIAFTGEKGMAAYPDLRLWDLTKRELDGMARQARRQGDPDEGIYAGFAAKLRDHLDTMGEAGKAYKAARASAAKQFGAENAYEAGIKFASAKGMSARDAIKGISKLKPEERKLFREGYIQAMRDRLKDAPNNRDATLQILTSDGAVERARIALGKDGAKKLEAQIEIEKAMDLMRKRLGNSTTARQLTELGLASAAGSGSMAASGNTDVTSLSVGAMAGIAGKYGKTKLDARLSSEIGKLLASNDQGRIIELINRASQSPRHLEAIKSLTKALTQNAPAAVGRAVTEGATP
jgi:hypothetical protein